MSAREVTIRYRGHTGKVTTRRIVPVSGSLCFRATAQWREPTWMFQAHERSRACLMWFALAGVLAWGTTEEITV